MGYVGNSPALKYTSFAVQHFTTSATTGYTLDHAVNNENDIRLVINNVVQQPGGSYAYTASGTTLTLSAATAGTDTMYCVFLGKAVQTVNPSQDSVGLNQLNATGTASSSTFLRGDNSWAAPGGVSLTGSTNNTVATVTGADALAGETNFIYDGTIIGGGADGANADLGVGLHIKVSDTGASVNAGADSLVLEDNGGDMGMTLLSSTSGQGRIEFGDSGGSTQGGIKYDHGDDSMRTYTADGERMRIESNGKQKYNTTADFGGTWFHYRGTFNANRGLGINSTDGTTGVPMVYFGVQNAAQGDINAGGGSVTYNTSSDYRRKENVQDFINGIDKVKQLKVYTFNFIDDPDKTNKGGFFAHEVDAIVPEAISGDKDEVQKYKENQDIPEGKSVGDNILDEEGNTIPEYQRIDHSKMIPVLTKALQEAITKIETLETENTDIKTRLTALESA